LRRTLFGLSVAAACLVGAYIASTSASPATGGSLQRVTLADPTLGIEDAMSLDIPTGWQFEGIVVRNVPCSPGDAFPQVQASSPDGAYSITIMTPFFTTSQPTDFDLRTCGTVAPLMPAAIILSRYVVPAIRRGAETSNPEPVPQAEGFLRSVNRNENGIVMSGDAARVRVSYTMNGQRVEEYVVGLTVQMRRQGMPGGTSSTTVQIFRAPPGKLDEFVAMASSKMTLTPNPNWQQRNQELTQQAAARAEWQGNRQRAAILQNGQDAGAAGRAMLANTRAQIQATGQASMNNAARSEAARHAGAVGTMDYVGDRPTQVYFFCNGSGATRTNNNPNSPGPGWFPCN
jgi:hypothetical protein